MTAHRSARAVLVALTLAGCATAPPKGLAPPAASEASGSEVAVPPAPPPDGRLVALRVAVENPPEGLLDEQGAGVLTLRREGERAPIRLVFGDGALGLYALPRGIYRIERVAGYDCGPLHLVLAPGETPLALGQLSLALGGERDGERGALAGGPATSGDIARIAALSGTDPAAVDAVPLERRRGISCRRDPRAVSRPDIDPTIRKLTPTEIALTVVLGGLIGAAGGYAIAAGSFVFVSGAGGGLIFFGT
ncbi:hypothetical protein M1105_19415 [Limibaculum sp. FT325]|uniref:hypothetical protein n=1 Tax=Thermohalobaculum sediminis TaxID=2939436 RepID=UPI0020C04094|nr:hypothetical protein [Limibaculum sediminis]MCL5779137.1 hypothetical protein [Limibaculum sediminis]